MPTTEEVAKRWHDWLAEHIKTCATCEDAFVGSGEQGMCEAAFEYFKQCARDAHETPAT
jgi:hypothetical protein